jgi:hypothetical protein
MIPNRNSPASEQDPNHHCQRKESYATGRQVRPSLDNQSTDLHCANNVITPISLPLFSPIRSTVPLSRNRGSATRTIGGKYKDKVLYRGIGVYANNYSYSMCT